jgi:lysophospholipase L1-like esterase
MKKNILFLLYTLLVIACSIELLYRLTGRYISYGEKSSNGGYNSPFETRSKFGYGWSETPNPFTLQNCNKQEFQYQWWSNNEGLRGDTIALQKSGKRIMVFGDSFTEGMGAPNDSTYPKLLGDLIHRSIDTSIEVINCGPSGSDVFTEYKLLTGKMLKYKPDIVLVTFNSTDLYEYTIRGGFERFKANNTVEYRKAPWFEPLYAKSYFFRFLVHDIFDYDYRFLKNSDSKKIDKQAIEEVCKAIDSFNTTCASNNCKFGMVFHPMFFEYPSDDYQMAPVIDHCNKANIPTVDMCNFLQKSGIHSITPEIYWPKDGHFNGKGYELLAKTALELFEQENKSAINISVIQKTNN